MFIAETSTREYSSVNKAAIYHILIRGKITSALIHIVDDMQIRQESEEDLINLVKQLPEQSVLPGLLNALNQIQHEILLVRILNNIP